MMRRLQLLLGGVILAAACTQAPGAPSQQPAGKVAQGQAVGGQQEKPTRAPDTVRIGYIGSTTDGGIFVAMAKGYFEQQAIKIEDTRFDAVTAMMAPLAAGQLDVVSGAMAAGLFNAMGRDIKVRIVADKGSLVPGYGTQGLVFRKDLVDGGQLRDIRDLKGRKVGVPGHTAGSHFILVFGRAVEGAGMTLEDMELVNLTIPDLNTALANKSLDAGMQLEPLITLGEEQGIFTIWRRSDQLYPNEQYGWILYSEDFAKNKPDAARRFALAYLRGVRDYTDAFQKNRGKDEVVKILAQYTSVKQEEVHRKIVPASFNPDGQINRSTLKADQQWYVDHGYVKTPIDVDSLVDPQFVEAALKELGPYR